VTGVLASAGGNITDLTTRLANDLYVLIAEVDLPSTVDVEELAGELRRVATEFGVEAALRPVESDVL
jgi:glycine cleavage system transcriptional repressor